ncbi:hypothetical protein OU798_07455 [Prolixibacteraceae bacterium Z1-6]|uniref:Uncharacterized protein n=1 Tax=Draconibacterium aestuarii TaxID=2998507 RepID=A0A9X3FCP5_9BACT|nr:hypothetical protein [Prolixibacteraceae bacterium Z1-6]
MENTVMDIVYVLGTGSGWNDNEIRFSLRSIEKNLRNVGKVFVVGQCPAFLQNIIHIPAADIFEPGLNADGNIITKVLAACNDKRLSDDFLFINDDHLVLNPMNIEDVPPLHKGDMCTFNADYWKLNFWRGRLKRTKEILERKGYTTLHFDCHTPIIFNKTHFPEIVEQFNYKDDIGYTMKSLYGNVMYPDAPFLIDQKRTVFSHYTVEQLNERLAAADFMSFNDLGLNRSLKWWLIENFTSKSRFEKDYPKDRIFDLYLWQLNGCDYKAGVELFCQHNKNRHKNLQQMFRMGETETLRKKLNFKLNTTIKEL